MKVVMKLAGIARVNRLSLHTGWAKFSGTVCLLFFFLKVVTMKCFHACSPMILAYKTTNRDVKVRLLSDYKLVQLV